VRLQNHDFFTPDDLYNFTLFIIRPNRVDDGLYSLTGIIQRPRDLVRNIADGPETLSIGNTLLDSEMFLDNLARNDGKAIATMIRVMTSAPEIEIALIHHRDRLKSFCENLTKLIKETDDVFTIVGRAKATVEKGNSFFNATRPAEMDRKYIDRTIENLCVRHGGIPINDSCIALKTIAEFLHLGDELESAVLGIPENLVRDEILALLGAFRKQRFNSRSDYVQNVKKWMREGILPKDFTCRGIINFSQKENTETLVARLQITFGYVLPGHIFQPQEKIGASPWVPITQAIPQQAMNSNASGFVTPNTVKSTLHNPFSYPAASFPTTGTFGVSNAPKQAAFYVPATPAAPSPHPVSSFASSTKPVFTPAAPNPYPSFSSTNSTNDGDQKMSE